MSDVRGSECGDKRIHRARANRVRGVTKPRSRAVRGVEAGAKNGEIAKGFERRAYAEIDDSMHALLSKLTIATSKILISLPAKNVLAPPYFGLLASIKAIISFEFCFCQSILKSSFFTFL